MRYWRLTPRLWRRETTDDQAWMIAFMLFENTREAYRHEWKEANRAGNRNAQRDETNFAAMRNRLK
jgi:hypothetical protein